MYITTEGVKSAIANSPSDSSKITMQATGALSWRRADIKYRKNEAFVDVIEDVNLLMSASGAVLRADVVAAHPAAAEINDPAQAQEAALGVVGRCLVAEDGVLPFLEGGDEGAIAGRTIFAEAVMELTSSVGS